LGKVGVSKEIAVGSISTREKYPVPVIKNKRDGLFWLVLMVT